MKWHCPKLKGNSGHEEGQPKLGGVDKVWSRTVVFTFTLLLIEFLDEFVFGAREAAWPLVRTDLGLG